MGKIKIHVLRTGEVRVSPYLPFGGDDCSIIKASGVTTPKSKWIWLPVFSFLIEHPKGKILFDTGWHREMSPDASPLAKLLTSTLSAWASSRRNWIMCLSRILTVTMPTA